MSKNVAGFQFRSRSNKYVISNCEFYHDSMIGYSYDWYEICKVINGKMILNVYNYSSTTIKHKYKIRSLLKALGIEIQGEIECPQGLQYLDSGISLYESRIKTLKDEMNNPKSKKFKNAERLLEIDALNLKIDFIKSLQGDK